VIEDRVRFALPCLDGQLVDGSAEQGVNPVGDQLGRRFEGETPLVQPRVWQLENWTSTHSVTRDQEIEVEQPRSPPLLLGSIATFVGLEFTTPAQKVLGRLRPLEQDCSVEELGLRWADRVSAPQRRPGRDPSLRGEGFARAPKGCPRLADIATKTDDDLHHSDHRHIIATLPPFKVTAASAKVRE
jgi:hypothetical protein